MVQGLMKLRLPLNDDGSATEWYGKRGQTGRVVPKGFPRGLKFG